MSLLGYASFTIAALMVVLAFAQSRDPRLLLTTLPMLAALLVIPILLTRMNQKAMADVDCTEARLCRLDRIKSSGGRPVRVRGMVERIAFAWMNRPHITIREGDDSVKIIMFTAPPEKIRVGDYVEAVGVVRTFGFSKEKKIWGVRVQGIPRRTQHNKGQVNHTTGKIPGPEPCNSRPRNRAGT